MIKDKIKTFKIISAATFAVLVVACLAAFAVVSLLPSLYYSTPLQKTFEEKEVVSLKVGEKVKLSDVNPAFKEMADSGALDGYVLGAQSCVSANSDGDAPHNTAGGTEKPIYADENGYLTPLKTGLYRYEYVVTRSVKSGTRPAADVSETFIFKNTFAVYEGDEENYEPFPDDGVFAANKNYILTKDVTIRVSQMPKKYNYSHTNIFFSGESYNCFVFDGLFVNPDGYTITLDIDGFLNDVADKHCVLKENTGIIDGLKLKIITHEEKPLPDFYGLAYRNAGLIRNCEITGDVYVHDEKYSNAEKSGDERVSPAVPSFYATSVNGIYENNVFDLSVFSDDFIYPYFENDRLVGTTVEKYSYRKDNSVTLDCHPFHDYIKNGNRNINNIFNVRGVKTEKGLTDDDGNTFSQKNCAIDTSLRHVVTVKFPSESFYGDEGERKYYNELQFPLYDGEYLDLNPFAARCLGLDLYNGGNSDGYFPYDLTEIKSWKVGGETRGDLNGIKVKGDVTVEPTAKYRRTVLSNDAGTNTGNFIAAAQNSSDGVFDLSELRKDGCVIGGDFFFSLLANPLNEVPEKIIIGANSLPDPLNGSGSFFSLTSYRALHEYIKKGGSLEIRGGNPDMALIGGKYLCNADGTVLEYLFSEEGETEIILPDRIKTLKQYAFQGGINYENADLSFAENFHDQLFIACKNLKRVKFGAKTSFFTGYDNIYDSNFNFILQYAPTVEEVEISALNADYRAENNFIIKISDGALMFSPKTLAGKIAVPEGVKKLYNGSITSPEITEVGFPASLEFFSDACFSGTEKLEKITFKSENVGSETGSPDEMNKVFLPSLREIEFGDEVKFLNMNASAFSGAPNLGTFALPKNLEEVGYLPKSVKEYAIAEENAKYETISGVLYDKTNKTLVSYPSEKAGKTYTVKDGTEKIGRYAFYRNENLEEAVFPASVREIGDYAFSLSKLKTAALNAEGAITFGIYAFNACAELSEFSVIEGAELYLGGYAFAYCEKLGGFPSEKVLSVGLAAFRRSAIKEFTLNETVTAVPEHCFSECKELERINIGGAVSIGQNAFLSCEKLKGIYGAEVQTVGSFAFKDCLSLATAYFPKARQVRCGAFENCGKLEEITLKDKASLEEKAFSGCVSLISFNSVATDMSGTEIFKNCEKITSVKYENSERNAAFINSFEGAKSLKEVSVEAKTATFENSFKNCVSLEKITVKAEEASFNVSAFLFVEGAVRVYVDAAAVAFDGKLPENVTLYVRRDILEEIKNAVLADDGQILAYDFD